MVIQTGTIPMTTRIFDIVCLLLFFESTIEELDVTVESNLSASINIWSIA